MKPSTSLLAKLLINLSQMEEPYRMHPKLAQNRSELTSLHPALAITIPCERSFYNIIFHLLELSCWRGMDTVVSFEVVFGVLCVSGGVSD